MFTWFFKYFAAMRFRKESANAFGLYRAAQETAYSAMQETLVANAKAKQFILNAVKELELLCLKALELQYFKDFLGLKQYVSQPVFTVAQAAEISNKRSIHRLLLMGFILSETFLYYIISGFVIPGLDNIYAMVAISLFFAFLCMFGIHWGLEGHYQYIYANERFAEKRIKPDVLKKINHNRMIGYAVSSLCFLFIIAAGMTRIFLVEGAVAVTSFDNPTQEENYAKGSAWISMLTMVFTLILGFLLAKIKLDLFELNPLYKTYREWLGNKKKTEGIIRDMEKNNNVIESNMEIARNKGWQLILDLQNIMGREYDEQDKELYHDYVNARKQAGFLMNSDMFNKYYRLLTAFRELYDYTIQQHPDMIIWSTEMKKAHEMGEAIIEDYNKKLAENAELPFNNIGQQLPENGHQQNGHADAALKQLLDDVKTKSQNGSHKHTKTNQL